MDQQWREDLIPINQETTLDGMFAQRVARSGQDTAYRDYDRKTKQWRDYSWKEMEQLIGCCQQMLLAEGLRKGDRVALQLRNSPEWVVFDQAAQGLSLVVVPLYTDDRPDNIAYILEDAEIRLLLVQDLGRWRRLARVLSEEGPLQRVWVLEGGIELGGGDERVAIYPELERQKRQAQEGEFPFVHVGHDGRALASIVYTSGTTGRPKGVMLSHYNMLSVAHAALTMVDVYRQDIFLSFLPLSHTLERTAGYYLPVMTGSTVAFSRSVAQLAEDLQQIRPTALIAVPRIFERVYGRITDQVQRGPAIARTLFRSAVRVGWQRFQHQQGRTGWRPGLLAWPLLERLVAGKISARLGGRLRIAVSGGAPLSPDIARLFIGLGLPILQGYGLTETSPVISVNTLQKNDPASVGLPLRGIQVKIGENDELLVKTPGAMLGYWNNHTATRRMIDSDGWLHTGDQARIDNGHIHITGRIKDILVLSNGEKVPPSDMELAIALDPLIEQVMVVGEGRPYLSALLVLDADFWPGFAQDCGLDPMSPESLRDHRAVHEMQKRVKAALKDFPGYAKIRRVTLLLEPWSIDNGLLTPTLKVKRAKVSERYAEEIEAMYDQGLTS